MLLQAPGVNQDSLAAGAIHIRNEHLEVQYRINGIVLPEGVSFFGQGLDPRFVNSMQLITGTLPAEYGLRVAGIVDIQTKSGLFQPGGSVAMRAGSYDTVEPSFEYGGSAGGYNYFVSGDHLESSHGIEGVTPSYNAIHDDTLQTHAFVYVDKIINSVSKIAFVGGTFQGQFQIPNNPGQPVAFGPGNTCVNAGCAPGTPLDNTIAGVGELRFGLPQRASDRGQFLRDHFLSALGGEFRLSGLSLHQIRHACTSTRIRSATCSSTASRKMRCGRASRTAFRPTAATGSAQATHCARALYSGRKIVGGRQLVGAADHGLYGGGAIIIAAGCPLSGAATFSPTPVSIAQDQAKTGWLYSAYVQDEWKVLPKVTLNYGGRFDVVNEFTMENQISPRVNAVWTPIDTTTVHAGYANYFTPPPFELVSTGSLTNPVLLSSSASCSANCVNSPVKSERSHVFDAGVTQEVLPGAKIGVDVYYKYARNLLDEGQFGAPVILTPFNYHVGYNKGVELTTSYDKGPFSYYGNLAIGKEKGEGISSAEFNFSASDLAYIATHPINTDHSQLMTASAGMSYLWKGTRCSVDIIAGTGLRTTTATGAPNEETTPSYEQVNLGVSHTFDLPYGGPLEIGFDVINALDEVYLIRGGGGVGVFAPAYGPRRTFFATVRKDF